ncbi:ribbon-helix-helix domain-containing protein [Synechococcus sp. CS-1325]|nr:ribbon-helix-helix domain-containing protein [Synechococcus sp. CS-1325]
MRPLAVRLPPELIHWLDAHRGGEARTTFLRAILRDHIRRQSRSKPRAHASAPQRHTPLL